MIEEINRIERHNLTDEAYKQIKDNIQNNIWREGDKIPSETQLCNSFHVSRVVVREALQRLRSEHLILTYQGRGSYVANPQNYRYPFGYSDDTSDLSYQKFMDIMEFRSCIEHNAIKRAVVNATDVELEHIVNLAEEMADSIDDPEKFTKIDMDYHMTIIRCSHNEMYMKAMESCYEDLLHYFGAMNKLNTGSKLAASFHLELAEYLKNRDSKAAITYLKRNEEYNLARMKQLYYY